MKEIRAVRATEVSLKLKQCKKDKGLFLLYIDSRACRKILDETFGIFGWKNTFREIKGVLFCAIEIWDEDNKRWVYKEDCGTASVAEKEKGEASDAFKRAAFSVGVARELYTKIPIWIEITTIPEEIKGKTVYKPKNKFISFNVARLEVNDKTKKISYICVTDKNSSVVFEWGTSLFGEPYIDSEAERLYQLLLFYCEQISLLGSCKVSLTFRATMKEKEHNSKGYSQACVELKERIKELQKKKEGEGDAK